MSQEDSEFTIISEKKNVLLEKNNLGDFRINIPVNTTIENESIFDIIKNKCFFDLLYELNKDIIEKFEITNDNNDVTIDDIKIIFKDVTNEDNVLDDNEEILINLKIKTNCISDTDYELSGLNIQNNSSIKNESVNMENFLIKVEKKSSELINIKISFSIKDNEKPDFLKTYICLYFQKIFYKIKLYFE
jgi:hypothetical protein